MAFSMYDRNNSGDLSSDEISIMIKECYGKISSKNNIYTMLKKFDTDGDSKVSRTEFIVTCKKYPIFLQPAIDFQKKVMALISTDQKFWNNIYRTSNR
jgi:hypothetical protein